MFIIILDIIGILVALCGTYFLIKYLGGKNYRKWLIHDLFQDISFKEIFHQKKDVSEKPQKNNKINKKNEFRQGD